MHEMIGYKENIKGRVTWYYRPYDPLRDKPKGDEMSKRTEINYRNLKNGNVEFAGFKNVMTLDDIDGEIGIRARSDLYAKGRCYYAVPGRSRGSPFQVRIYNSKENIIARDFLVGSQYSSNNWAFFIEFLVEAGERYGEIKADLKAGEVQKIVI